MGSALLPEGPATVDDQVNSGNKTTLLGCKKAHCMRHFTGVAEPANRSHLLKSLLGLLIHYPVGLLREEHSRTHCVDGNSPVGHGDGKVAGQIQHSSLGGMVGRLTGWAQTVFIDRRQ